MLHSMARVNRLLDHEEYIRYIEKINELEKERRFCRHGFEHGLSVARIAYTYLLEKGDMDISKEGIYAAALLHDIGRWVEYQTGEDHAEASARMALPLLEECGFRAEEIHVISIGIREHRRHHGGNLSPLGQALAIADDWSRECRSCSAQTLCYKFKPEMKQIVY